MKFFEEPGFSHTESEPRYFVRCLDETDGEYSEGLRYEIQLLNDDGEGGAIVLFSNQDTKILVPGYDLPLEVIDAAQRQEKGLGDYVNSRGESVRPF